MEFAVLDPPLPSWSRFRRMKHVAPGQSIVRALEYEIMDDLTISGRVLDFGGGRKAGYARWLAGADEVVSVNIDTEFDPSHVVEPGAPLPFDNQSFDTIVTLNTLEHVYDDIAAVGELARVLKPGGEMHIIVPFLFRVHGHPDDYNRHTPSWWGKTLERYGMSKAHVLPLIFGRRTTAQMVSGRGGRVLRPITDVTGALRDLLYAQIFFAGQTHYVGRRGTRVWSQAPGWYIHAEK